MNEVAHLGHVLSYNLDDTPDIIRAVRDMNRKVNSILFTFSAADPFVKSFLVKIYCFSLYGCSLWALNSPSLKVIETALNKLLRKSGTYLTTLTRLLCILLQTVILSLI